MVSVQHPSRVVPRLQGIDRRIGGEVGTRERGEDAAPRDRLRLAGGIAHDQDVVRVRALREPEWDSRSARTRTTSDRKSTRLNSSHVRISYAVFCLKKKKNA